MQSKVVQRFFRHRLALVGLVVLIILVTIAILAPYISPYSYRAQDLSKRNQPPSSEHWFGTDSHGRDLLTRVFWGARVSLTIGLCAVSGSLLVGLILGMLAGFYGGIFDWIIMRFTDVVLCIPALFVIMVLVAVFGASFYMTIGVIMAVYWPSTARLVRAEFLKLREAEFAEAGRAIGLSNFRLVVFHLLPNAAAPLIVQATLQLAQAIVLEAGLSFLGLGAQPPTPSWGNILADGHAWMRRAPWIATIPGVFIWLTTLSFNLVGDGLRDALDPKQL